MRPSSDSRVKASPSAVLSVKSGAGWPATTIPTIRLRSEGMSRLHLPAQAELADQRAVALEIVSLQVVEEAAASADEHQQAAARVMVVLVLAQVLGQVVDAMRQQRHLDLGLAGVVLVLAEPRDDVALLLCGHAHVRPCRVAAMTRSRPACLAA